ncbi:MAG: PH domain-containing protein [Actinocatenispora sp.]
MSTPAPDTALPSTGTRADEVPQWTRLSTRMLIIHPVQHIIQAAPALLGLLVAGTTSDHGPLWGVIGAGVAVCFGLLRWFTTTYRISPEQVQVRRGLLRRRVLSVPRDRIRTVDLTAPAMHRVLGMTRVTVGTGLSNNSRNDGLRLDALMAPTAAELREELLHRRPSAHTAHTATDTPAPAGPAEGTTLARLSPRWIGYGPFTLSGLVTVSIIGAFLSRFINEFHVDPSRYGAARQAGERLLHTPVPVLVTELVAALLVLAAIASTCGYVLAFWNFRLVRLPGGTLHVTRGLITTRATTIEERRLRGVEVSEPLLLRIVRGARCIAIATGLRVGRGAERGGSLLLPSAPRAEAVRVASVILRHEDPIVAPLTAHGSAARRRRYTRALVPCLVLVGLLVVAWRLGLPGWLPLVGLLSLPIATLLAADRYRSLGHRLIDGILVTRRGSLVRRRCALPCDGIIGWNVHQSFFQRRAGLATLTATTAGGGQAYPVQDIAAADVAGLAETALPGLLRPFLVEAEQQSS